MLDRLSKKTTITPVTEPSAGPVAGAAQSPPALRSPDAPATTAAGRGRVNAEVAAGATSRGPWGGFELTVDAVERARDKGPAAMAEVLRAIACDRTGEVIPNDAARLANLEALLGGLSRGEIDELRAQYIHIYGADPEVHMHSWDLFQPLLRLEEPVTKEMIRLLNGPMLEEQVARLSELLDRASSGALTSEDRATYFSELPLLGLWDKPMRQVDGGPNLDALERTLLKELWAATRPELSFDDALSQIEAKLPPPDLSAKAPRDRSIAVIASSHGAQWQELMDWLMVMDKAGYSVQVFTPEGRPVAFQEDSLCVSKHTTRLGFGAPLHLDPRGEAGQVARKALATTAPAASFDVSKFGAVYAAGGLGFNEDVAVVTLKDGEVSLKANPNIEKMIRAAVDVRFPQIALCYGPTIYAAVSAKFGDKYEPISAGLLTSSLPPFEGYVALTGRKGPQFNVDVDTHREMHEAGGKANRKTMVQDILNMSRVTRDGKHGLRLVTGPGPQTSFNLGAATIEELARRWPKG
jgi:hypothetical protein